MHIQLEYTLTPDDYFEFQKAYLRNRRALLPRSQRGLRSVTWVIWGIMFLILLLFVIVTTVLTPSPAPAPAAAPGPAPGLSEFLFQLVPYPILIVLVFGVLIWVRRSGYLYRRLAVQVTRLGETRTAEITDSTLTIVEPTATTTMQWNHFIRFAETKGVFVLFTVPRAGHIIPKRAFSAEAFEEFRRFAQARIGNQPIGFPVQPGKAIEQPVAAR